MTRGYRTEITSAAHSLLQRQTCCTYLQIAKKRAKGNTPSSGEKEDARKGLGYIRRQLREANLPVVVVTKYLFDRQAAKDADLGDSVDAVTKCLPHRGGIAYGLALASVFPRLAAKESNDFTKRSKGSLTEVHAVQQLLIKQKIVAEEDLLEIPAFLDRRARDGNGKLLTWRETQMTELPIAALSTHEDAE